METRLLVGLKEGRVKISQTFQVVFEVWRYAGDLTFGCCQGRECKIPLSRQDLPHGGEGERAWFRHLGSILPTNPTPFWVGSSSLGVKHIYLESADLNQTEGQP